MKQLLLFLFILSFYTCDKTEDYNDVLPYRVVDFVADMNLPEYVDLQIPGQSVETDNYGLKGIVIYNFNGNYKAFDLACPQIPLSTCSRMTFDGSLFLNCPCDEAKFSIYDGSPQTDGVSYWAREYYVVKLSNSQLRITN